MIAVILLFACGAPAPVEQRPPDALPGTPHPELPTGSVGATGTADIADPAPAGRTPRRMNVDQLRAAMEQVSGGVVWEEDGVAMFEDLAPTLGRPDWITSTTEDLAPGLLFQKFLDDAATYTCEEILQREAASPDGHVLLVDATLADTWSGNPAAVRANLSRAVLRWHGHVVPADDPALEPWTFLFESTLLVTEDDTWAGWRAVCVGLFTHPDFYSY